MAKNWCSTLYQHHGCWCTTISQPCISSSVRSSSNYLWFCVFHSQVKETGSTYPHRLVQLLSRDGNAVFWAFRTKNFTTTPARMRKIKINMILHIFTEHALYDQKLFDNLVFHNDKRLESLDRNEQFEKDLRSQHSENFGRRKRENFLKTSCLSLHAMKTSYTK